MNIRQPWLPLYFWCSACKCFYHAHHRPHPHLPFENPRDPA